jgi:hypothetical protein
MLSGASRPLIMVRSELLVARRHVGTFSLVGWAGVGLRRAVAFPVSFGIESGDRGAGVTALREENEALRGDNVAMRKYIAALKVEMQAMQQTLSRFVTSEKKEKYYQAILEEQFKAGHLRIEGVGH